MKTVVAVILTVIVMSLVFYFDESGQIDEIQIRNGTLERENVALQWEIRDLGRELLHARTPRLGVADTTRPLGNEVGSDAVCLISCLPNACPCKHSGELKPCVCKH